MANTRKTLVLTALLLILITSASASIAINGSRLDMRGNPIQGFFDTTGCGSNEAVTQVYANGSYNCGQAGGGLPTVLGIDNSANNSRITDLAGLDMTGDIQLQGNNIVGGTGSTIEGNAFRVNDFLSLEGNDIENGGIINANQFNAGGDSIMTSSGIELNDFSGLCVTTSSSCSPSSGTVSTEELDNPNDNNIQVQNTLDMNSNWLEHVYYLNPQGDTLRFGNNFGTQLDMGDDYLKFSHSGEDFFLGGEDTPDASESGIHLEADTNPDNGEPIFVVESSGGAERLRVEHSGDVYSENDFTTPGDFVGEDLFVSDDIDGPTVFTDLLKARDNSFLEINDDVEITGGFDIEQVDYVRLDNLASRDGDYISVEDTVDIGANDLTGQTQSSDPSRGLFFGGAESQLYHEDDVALYSDWDGEFYSCKLDGTDGSFDCSGSKNWIHPINETHIAEYSSQESGEVRAVVDDTTMVDDKVKGNYMTTVEYPKHFSDTIAKNPDIKAQVTPHDLATVAVTERTNEYIVIEADKEVKVDYTIKGIRQGYEDKQIVKKSNRTWSSGNRFKDEEDINNSDTAYGPPGEGKGLDGKTKPWHENPDHPLNNRNIVVNKTEEDIDQGNSQNRTTSENPETNSTVNGTENE